jgi:hypothetical protein
MSHIDNEGSVLHHLLGATKPVRKIWRLRMAYLLIERQGRPGQWKFCGKNFQTVHASLDEACKRFDSGDQGDFLIEANGQIVKNDLDVAAYCSASRRT